MPYTKTSQLPSGVQMALPSHAQSIYKEAFNSAWNEYKSSKKRRGDSDREQTAHKVAWSAVKSKYHKGDDNKWHPKD